jgi:hypothetical protein
VPTAAYGLGEPGVDLGGADPVAAGPRPEAALVLLDPVGVAAFVAPAAADVAGAVAVLGGDAVGDAHVLRQGEDLVRGQAPAHRDGWGLCEAAELLDEAFDADGSGRADAAGEVELERGLLGGEVLGWGPDVFRGWRGRRRHPAWSSQGAGRGSRRPLLDDPEQVRQVRASVPEGLEDGVVRARADPVLSAVGGEPVLGDPSFADLVNGLVWECSALERYADLSLTLPTVGERSHQETPCRRSQGQPGRPCLPKPLNWLGFTSAPCRRPGHCKKTSASQPPSRGARSLRLSTASRRYKTSVSGDACGSSGRGKHPWRPDIPRRLSELVSRM